MGKSSLILVLGMSVIIGFFILKMNANSKENVSATVNMFEQTHARLIANSGVETYLEKLYFDRDLINTTIENNELMNGSYDVTLEGTYLDVKITSTATFMDVTHTSVVHAALEELEVPALKGALQLPTSEIVWSNVGNATLNINGHDHNWDGERTDTSMNPASSTYGIYVDNDGDKSIIVEKLEKNKNAYIYGKDDNGGVDYSIGVNPDGYNAAEWKALSELLVSAAQGNVFDSKSKIPSPLGTKDEPTVAVINEPDTSKQVSLNNFEGCGILVVNGNVKIAGTFQWHGLIVAYKDSKMEFDIAGTPEIIGAILATGNTIEFLGKGTVDLKYSSEAIKHVFDKAPAYGYKILSWWE